MIRKIKILILFLGFVFSSFSQTEFSGLQYIFNPSIINPAAITTKNMSLQMYYRNQLSGIEQAPQTQFISFKASLEPTTSILVGLHNTTAGPSSIGGIQLGFAHIINLKKVKLSFGLQGELRRMMLDETKFVLEQENDDAISYNLQKRINAQSSAGVYLLANKWSIGFSTFNLINNKDVYTKIINKEKYLSFNIYADYSYSWKNKIKFIQSIMFEKDDIKPSKIDINFITKFNDRINLGVTYSTLKSIAVILGIQSNQLEINYIHTIPNSSTSNFLKGTNELLLIYKF
ncbi:MAG: type IX secretion system membrane protein PorP/SprF [Flavobacteriales bacterium]|nr:type IX secretion system membrane protein PorP/SprF [Flavobacteriales bacterium]